MNYVEGDWVYDVETFPNCFTFTILKADGTSLVTYEISTRKNQSDKLFRCLSFIKNKKQTLVGFNNVGFDYPIIHQLFEQYLRLEKKGKTYEPTADYIYDLAQKQIESFRGEFGNTIRADDCLIKQRDLFKIHHFDNRAKSTSLKMLEFNMLSDNIEDLPYPVGTMLTEDQMDELITYNQHDVKETLKFYQKSIPAILLREDLGKKYNMDFTNHNDTKIGKDYFINRLEDEMPGSCYTFDGRKKKIRQTRRDIIHIKDCLFDYYDFKRPEFQAVLAWFKKQRINETKGVFSDIDEAALGDVAKYATLRELRQKFKGKPSEDEIRLFKHKHPLGWIQEEELKGTYTEVQPDGTKVKKNKVSYWKHWRIADTLNVVIDGFQFDFGTGGIHGSVTDKIVRATHKYVLKDADVKSMYPNIAISNNVYPEHLGQEFCTIYKAVYELRMSYQKSTPENAVMKLALNGVYGDSNNKYGPFYDPQYTMKITINGQLSLCLLAERLLEIEGLKLVQVNTDGVTVALPIDKQEEYAKVCDQWQKQVGLELEYADYSKMFIRDVNNYVALYTNGKVKYKGAYVFKREELGWHQNHGGLIIPMAACAAMIDGVDLEEFIRNHKNKWDFFLRAKVPRSSKLIQGFGEQNKEGVFEQEVQLQNICRYYPSTDGGELVKIMPPLADKPGDRRLAIDKGWKVKVCNDVDNFSFDDINYDYYVTEAKKLLVGIGNKIERTENETDSED